MTAWTKADIRRAVQAVQQVVDAPIEGVEIWPDGRLRVLTKATADQQPAAPLDQWRAKRGPRAA